MATIRVPSRISAPALNGVLAAVIDAEKQPTDKAFTLDFQHVTFADASGIVMISNLIEWLRNRGVEIGYVNCVKDVPIFKYSDVIRYLDDAGFFETYWGEPLRPNANVRSTTYPFRRLHCRDSHQWVDGNLFPWVADAIGVDVRALDEFKACIREIFNNILDHSTEEIGCMHLQKYPNARQLKIAISDFGIGIPTEVRRVRDVENDVRAVILATQQGFSSKGGKNKGEGLSYLNDIVVGRNRGKLQIYSGNADVSFFPSAGAIGCSGYIRKEYYPGTSISMTLRTDTLEVPEDDGEMQWF